MRRVAGAVAPAAAGVALFLLGAAGCAPASSEPATPPGLPRAARPGGPFADVKARLIERFTGQPAPPFRLPDTDGREVALDQFRGRVVLINFWFSTCLPCREETPDLIALYRLHKDRGLVVLGVNTDRLMMPDAGAEPMRRFLKTYEIPYPVLLADHATYRAYGNSPVQPISFLIDRQGKVAQVFWGARPGAVFDRAVRPLLAAPAAARPAPPAPRPARPASPAPDAARQAPAQPAPPRP
jgi:peroxiredoxin